MDSGGSCRVFGVEIVELKVDIEGVMELAVIVLFRSKRAINSDELVLYIELKIIFVGSIARRCYKADSLNAKCAS